MAPDMFPPASGWARLPIRPRVVAPSTPREVVTALSDASALAVLALVPLPFGSVETPWIAVWCAVLGLSLATAPIDRVGPALGRTILALLATFGVFAAAALLQMSGAGAPDPAWASAGAALGVALPPLASASALMPLTALGPPLLAVLAFCRFAVLGASREGTDRVLGVLAWTGLAYALYGTASFILAPDALLWRDKTAYLDSLTGTFVNRNTAASYFGAVAVAWLARLVAAAGRRRYRGLSARDRLWFLLRGRDMGLLARACALLAALGAVAATGSRAGFFIAACALAATLLLLAGPRLLARRPSWAWLAALAALLATVELLGGAVTGRLNRLGLSGEGRFEVYAALLPLLGERPWLGWGLGTFDVVFPAIRPETISASGVWDRAHSTPLELAVEMGLPVAALVAALVLWILARLTAAALRTRAPWAVAGAACAWSGVLHSAIDFSLQIPGYAVACAAVTAAALARSLARAGEPSAAGDAAGAGRRAPSA